MMYLWMNYTQSIESLKEKWCKPLFAPEHTPKIYSKLKCSRHIVNKLWGFAFVMTQFHSSYHDPVLSQILMFQSI